MLLNSLIGKLVLVKLTDCAIKGTLHNVDNQFILVDERYINISHIIRIEEIKTQQDNHKAPFIASY